MMVMDGDGNIMEVTRKTVTLNDIGDTWAVVESPSAGINDPNIARELASIAESLKTIAGRGDSVGPNELHIELDSIIGRGTVAMAAKMVERFDIRRKA